MTTTRAQEGSFYLIQKYTDQNYGKPLTRIPENAVLC